MRAPWTVACWKPGAIAISLACPSVFASARYIVTPTKATISGRNLAIFRSRIVHPSMYSCGFSTSMPGLGRATRLVIPMPHSGSRTSSSCVTGSGTMPDS
jgi:hypothetical protein